MEFSQEVLSAALLEAAERAHLGVVITTREGDVVRTVYANQAMADILGSSLDEIRALPSLSFIAEDHRPRVLELSKQLRAGETVEMPYEVDVVRKDGKRLAMEWALAPVALDGGSYLLQVCWSVQRRRSVERAFKELIEHAPDGITITDRQGVVKWANRAVAEMLGWPDGRSLTGLRMSSLLHSDDAAASRKRIDAMMTKGERFPPREYRATRPDGRPLVTEIRSIPMEWEGEPAMLAIGRDITTRAYMQAQLAQTDRLAALGTLAAGVAHEINNPMAALVFAIEGIDRIIRRPVLDEKMRTDVCALLAELKRGSERITRIATDLTVFARGGDEKVSAVELATVVAAAERLAGHAVRGRGTLTVDLPALPEVRANATRLEQVVVNLLINALQSMPEQRSTELNRVTVTARERDDGRVQLDVTDNGEGIAPEHVTRIFEPFFTTKPVGVGTGLGLSICHGLVQQMGGEISVKSTLGEGTTVSVALPVSE